MDDIVRDYAEMVGALVALATFFWSVWTTRDGISTRHADQLAALGQAQKELRWRQTVQAQAAIKQLTDDLGAKNAMVMLDWDERVFQIEDKSIPITWEQMRVALRSEAGPFTAVEVFVRDAFDSLFDRLEMIKQQIDNELFEIGDVEYPIAYYSRRMKIEANWLPIKVYLLSYEFPRALALIEGVEDVHRGTYPNAERVRVLANTKAAPSAPP